MLPSLGLDHLHLRVRDLDSLLAFFRSGLGLPLSWPIRDEAFARHAWVNAGNVQLELWQARSNDDLPLETPLPCVAGAALWPQDIQQARRSLEELGVTCRPPKTWRTPASDGTLADNFTNCLVIDASSPSCQVFFCEWNPYAPITPWPKGEATVGRRERFAAELALSGARTGIIGLHAIQMESSDVDATDHVWTCLTGEHGRAAPDIALTISQGPGTRISALVFRVRDLPAAVSALMNQGMSTCNDANVVWIDGSVTHGLRIGLCDK